MMTSHAGIDAMALKVAAVGTAAGVGLAEVFASGTLLPFFNVTISTLGMATAGSMLAFAYGTPVSSRRKLYGYAIGGTFIGVWAVQVLPHWLGWQWYDPKMEPPIAGTVALLSRWIVPFVVENLPALWRRIFNTGKPTGEGE